MHDTIFAGLGLVLAASLVVFSYGYPLLAKLWIFVVAAGFVAIPSLLLLRRAGVARGRGLGQPRATGFTSDDYRVLVERTALMALFLVFVFAMQTVGFVVVAVAFVFCITYYFERRIVLASMAGVVTGLLIFVMKTSFGFFLPTGIFDL
jgi:hypothetical protein